MTQKISNKSGSKSLEVFGQVEHMSEEWMTKQDRWAIQYTSEVNFMIGSIIFRS